LIYYWDCFTIGKMLKRTKILFNCLVLAGIIFFSTGCRPGNGPSPEASSTNAPVSFVSHQEYKVHQQISLYNVGPGQPEKQNIWIALIHDFLPYQEVKSMEISPTKYTLVTDEYGNQYAEFDFSGQEAGTTQTINIDYSVVVNELSYNLEGCLGEIPDEFTQPELHIESDNPQIISLADELSQGKSTTCQQIRSFYDYIGNTLVYTPNNENWGAQAALGPMGADCTEYTDLLVALSRAHGIPARYFEGLLYMDQSSEAIAKIEHAWPDVYLPGIGWTALDPTLGRQLIKRDVYFAHYTPNHIIVTLGSSPSVLRGSSYWTHLYWPGDSTEITVNGDWKIQQVKNEGQ
jgi:transglutaminase-like putative cysteine protease